MASSSINDSEELQRVCEVCKIPCEKRCGNCHKVSYCGVPHQKFHRDTHRHDCYPVTEVRNDKFGRHLVATKDIPKGTILFKESAIIAAPFNTFHDVLPICLGCCQRQPGTIFDYESKGCPKCFWILCGDNCEMKHWHSDFECEIFSSAKLKLSVMLIQAQYEIRSPPDAPRTMTRTIETIYRLIQILRMLLLKNKDPAMWEVLLKLESHWEFWKKDAVEDPWGYSSIIFFIHDLCKLSPEEYPVDLVLQMYGVTITNSIGGVVRDTAKVGTTYASNIYEKCSKLSHNCVRNTCKLMKFDETWSESVMASVDIQKGEILFESYARDFIRWKGINERRQLLNNTYHFWCDCVRCRDPTELGTYSSAIKCKKVIEEEPCPGFYIPMINSHSSKGHVYEYWQCTNNGCKSIVSYQTVLKKIYLEVEDDVMAEGLDLDGKLRLLQKYEQTPIVHENHVLLMKLRQDIICALLTKGSQRDIDPLARSLIGEQMEVYVKKCLEISDKFHPGNTVERGFLLFYWAYAVDLQFCHLFSKERFAEIVTVSQCFELLTQLQSHQSTIHEAIEIIPRPNGKPQWMIHALNLMMDRKEVHKFLLHTRYGLITNQTITIAHSSGNVSFNSKQ